MDEKNKIGIELLKEIMKVNSISELSKLLNVNKNTIKRWILLDSVPWQYNIDLKKLLKLEVNYSEYSYIQKDQFFTSEETAIHCYNILVKKLEEISFDYSNYIFLEPSAGDGSFFKILPSNKKIGLDIEPRHEDVLEKDFFEWYPKSGDKIICIGNPPFGLRGNLALRFINHASIFSDFVAFILPPLFDSDGKGSCMKRIKNLNLIHSEKINTEFYYPNKETIKINVLFQIWSKHHKLKEEQTLSCSEYVKIYSLTDGGTPSTTRNKKMLNECDFYLASSSFEKEKMKLYPSFSDLPNRRGYGIKILKDYERLSNIINNIDWPSKSFLATNSSYNLRTSIINNALIENGIQNL